jgi:hypothetical protein
MRCLQSSGKKTSDKENIMATKPTKQQVAQAKARAGGNNPVKVTNAGLKKLGSAAVIAASFTPAGRVARGVATVAKAAKAEGVMAKAGWNAAAKTNYRAQVKREATANARGLKAANKPTKASKTFIGSNKNLSPSVRREIIVNQTKPARPNRERGGSLKTLRKQGKTGTSK